MDMPVKKRLALMLWLMAALMAMPLSAEVPPSRAQMGFSFAPVVKKTAPAVVNIYTRHHVLVQNNLSPLMNDPFFSQFFNQGQVFGGRPSEQVVSSLGSGVLVRADGMIVTSFHVIKDAQEVKVALSDKREFEATIVMRDPESDLAFLQIKADSQLPYLELRDSDTLEVGDLVLAIGNPFGVGQTVTNGIVSALARQAAGVSDYEFFIQTDAAINPGNSGGALVDMDGRLIGINTAIYSTSGGSHGIGFAIPANMVHALLAGKLENGRAVRPWLGIGVQPLTPEIAESQGLKTAQGVIVKKIAPGSPAMQGGLRVGDIITGVGATAVDSEQELQYRVALIGVGATAEFHILRQGEPRTLAIALQPPSAGNEDTRVLKGSHPLAGLTVANLSPALAMELGVDDGQGRVVVTDGALNVGGTAFALAPGDLILAVNGEDISSTAQLEQVLSHGGHGWKIVYRHGANVLTLSVNR